MAAPKTKSRSERAARLRLVSQRFLQQMRPSDIAVEIGVSQQQISYDLKAIRKQWRESTILNFDEAKAIELARIDAIETEYWVAWRKSQKRKIVIMTTDETGPNGKVTKTSKRIEKSPGDPRFLAGVHKCIEKRCQLLGLDATKSNDCESSRPIPLLRDVDSFSDAELMAIIEQSL